MAAVSAAMLRPPGGGLDPPYYPQMINYSPHEDSKTKKSWGQRLKLSPNGSPGSGLSNNSNHFGTVSASGGSSLSKSMKYAETWLYGTVRGPPSGLGPTVYLQYAEQPSPVLLGTPHPPVPNYAVVVCSCPEYLNGTKKGSSKKVSICKKCKGSRLPLGVPVNGTVRGQVIGGTMRGPPAVMNSGGTVRAGTVKLQSTSKSRPTILTMTSPNQSSDPYDLMRRTRLSSPADPNQVGSQFTAVRSRAKSISPVRNRGRRRSPSAESNKTRSKSVSRSQDVWYEDIMSYESELNGRRSILECDVNPYDLMQKKKIEEEDEVFGDLDNDDTFNLKKLQKNLSNCKKGAKHNGPYSNVQAISGQRIRVFGDLGGHPNMREDFVYDDVEDKSKDKTVILSTFTANVDRKDSSSSDNSTIDFAKEQKAEKPRNAVSSPKRPPRRNKTETSEEESESDRKEGRQKIVTKQLTVNNSVSFVANRSATSDQAIKSILKKPRDRPVRNERPASRTPPVDGAVSGSHFYLPTPPSSISSSSQSSSFQRKKVQFLVENEIISSSDQSVGEESAQEESAPEGVEANRSSVEVISFRSDVDSGGSHNPLNINDIEVSTDNLHDDNANARCISRGNDDSSVDLQPDIRDSYDVEVEIHTTETETTNRCSTERQETGRAKQVLKDSDNESFAKGVFLRRSQSERLTLEGSPESPSFLDTMALRPRPSRAHSRQPFISTQSLVEIVNVEKPTRPKDRPPPPPLSTEESVQSFSSSVTIVCGTPEDQHDDRTSVIPIKPKEIKFGDHLPAPPPRSRSKERKSLKKEPNYVKTRFIRDKNLLLDDSVVNLDIDDKTTVKVSGESVMKQIYESNTVHRLSVTQNDADADDSHKKTSIMISGDDCYSTVNVSDDTHIYQSSVTVNNMNGPCHTKSSNTVTISVYSDSDESSSKSNQIYILNSSDSSYETAPTSPASVSPVSTPTKTMVVVDYETVNMDEGKNSKIEERLNEINSLLSSIDSKTSRGTRCHENVSDMNSTSEEISILLRDPVEAVKRNLVPHVCGKAVNESTERSEPVENPIKSETELKNLTRSSFVSKLLEDPLLGHLAEGLDSDLVAKLIENSLIRLKDSRKGADYKINEDDEAMSRLIDASLLKLQEERSNLARADEKLDILLNKSDDDVKTLDNTPRSQDGNNSCSAAYESMEYESGNMGASSDIEPLSDCYNASVSELSTEEDNSTRSKFYQMLVDATLSEIEISHSMEEDHHYESIRLNSDPIYEEISDIPPPLPLNPPPTSLLDEDKKSRSIFEGASKYDILSYLVDAKERGIVHEDSYSFNGSADLAVEEDNETKEQIDHQRQSSDLSSRVSNLSNGSDSSEDNSLIMTNMDIEKMPVSKKSSSEIERNDSGVGSETSKCSRSRWQGHNIPPNSVLDNIIPIHLCEDCDGAVETQVTESGVMFAPLVCRKCGKKRAERKEIITEIVETEEKYGRDLQIILEEFYQPMLVAGLLTQEQLSAIFLNTEELLENNQILAEKLRDALEIAIEQGDEDLLTVNIGKLMLESAPMLHAFSSYCVRQGAASMLLSSLEKEKELLRIFLKVSQMENTVLRRMNLNSFLMVPVQRVTKYPLLLSRLFKVTPSHLEGREQLRQAQQKIEQHLTHMNAEAKDMTTLKLWRRISSNNGGRRSSSEIDMINIKLRKLAVDVLEWNHDEARFALEGKLLFTQPNDNNWRKGRTIKLTPVNALLVTNGKPTTAYKPNETRGPCFPRNTGVREASLVLARDKGGRTALLREPLYLDRCVVAAENDWDDYFELQEIVSKDTYIFKAEDGARTKQWCQQLQYHCQGMGAWRKRRNALANIMINGMMMRN